VEIILRVAAIYKGVEKKYSNIWHHYSDERRTPSFYMCYNKPPLHDAMTTNKLVLFLEHYVDNSQKESPYQICIIENRYRNIKAHPYMK